MGDTSIAPRASRPFLHAETLGFDHPVTGRRLRFTSELPDDLADLLAELEAGHEEGHVSSGGR